MTVHGNPSFLYEEMLDDYDDTNADPELKISQEEKVMKCLWSGKFLGKVELFYLQKWPGDWNRIYCFVTSVCVFRFVYTLLVKRNSEVKKMSSDSESNSFATFGVVLMKIL